MYVKAKLPKWFVNRLTTIKKHNNYNENWDTSTICDSHGKWTPCDLIIREYLNNGGGSARGFLGISRAECIRCYDFIKENKATLIGMDYITCDGWNNCGYPLWHNYNF